MAYIPLEDDEENQNQPQPGSETVISGSNTSINSGNGNGGQNQAASSSKPTSSGTGWTNLQTYVKANEGVDKQMAQSVRDNVSQKAIDSQAKAQSYQTAATQNINSKAVQSDQSMLKALRENPVQVDKNQFQSQLNASYQGPQSAEETEGYYDASQGYSRVNQLADSSRSFDGRASLVDDVYGRENYSQGEKRLDSFLLGQGKAKPITENVSTDYGTGSNFNTGWENVLNSVNQTIDSSKKTTEDTRKATQSAYNSAVNDQKTYLNSQKGTLDKTNLANTQAYKGIQSKLSSADPNERIQAYKDLGVDASQAEWLKNQGYDLQKLASANPNRKLGDVVNKTQIDAYDALLGLTDRYNQDYDFGVTGASADPFKVNQDDIASARDAYGLSKDIQSRLTSEQEKRNSAFTNASSAINPFTFVKRSPEDLKAASDALGLSTDDYQFALDQGLLQPTMISKGANLNYGDVASEAERSKWGDLLTSLGIRGDIDLQDTQDEGNAFSYKTGDLGNSIKSKKDEIEAGRLAAIEAKKKAFIEEEKKKVIEAAKAAEVAKAADLKKAEAFNAEQAKQQLIQNQVGTLQVNGNQNSGDPVDMPKVDWSKILVADDEEKPTWAIPGTWNLGI